eukprot:jgi/Mesvir1/4540/Mv26034-RA.2
MKIEGVAGSQHLVELVVHEEFGSGCLVSFMVTDTHIFENQLSATGQSVMLRIELDGQVVLEQSTADFTRSARLRGDLDKYTYTTCPPGWGIASFWPGFCFSSRARISFLMNEMLFFQGPASNISQEVPQPDGLRYILAGVEEGHNECSLRYFSSKGSRVKSRCKPGTYPKLSSNKDVVDIPPRCRRPSPPVPGGVYSINIFVKQTDPISRMPTMGLLANEASIAHDLQGNGSPGDSQESASEKGSEGPGRNSARSQTNAESAQDDSTKASPKARSPFGNPLLGPSAQFNITQGQRLRIWGHGNRENTDAHVSGTQARRGGILTALVLKPADADSSVASLQLEGGLWLIAEWDQSCPACHDGTRHGGAMNKPSTLCDEDAEAAEQGAPTRKKPQIEAPVWGLFHFHAMNPYPKPPPLLSAAFGSTEDDEWYLLWPMPFQYCARLYLEYRAAPVQNVSIVIVFADLGPICQVHSAKVVC